MPHHYALPNSAVRTGWMDCDVINVSLLCCEGIPWYKTQQRFSWIWAPHVQICSLITREIKTLRVFDCRLKMLTYLLTIMERENYKDTGVSKYQNLCSSLKVIFQTELNKRSNSCNTVFLQKSLRQSKESLPFMLPERSLPCLQKPVSGPYPEPDEPRPHHVTPFFKICFISPSYLCLSFSSSLLPSAFLTKILLLITYHVTNAMSDCYCFPIYLNFATCPGDLSNNFILRSWQVFWLRDVHFAPYTSDARQPAVAWNSFCAQIKQQLTVTSPPHLIMQEAYFEVVVPAERLVGVRTADQDSVLGYLRQHSDVVLAVIL